jgi:hypothetical protein
VGRFLAETMFLELERPTTTRNHEEELTRNQEELKRHQETRHHRPEHQQSKCHHQNIEMPQNLQPEVRAPENLHCAPKHQSIQQQNTRIAENPQPPSLRVHLLRKSSTSSKSFATPKTSF